MNMDTHGFLFLFNSNMPIFHEKFPSYTFGLGVRNTLLNIIHLLIMRHLYVAPVETNYPFQACFLLKSTVGNKGKESIVGTT